MSVNDARGSRHVHADGPGGECLSAALGSAKTRCDMDKDEARAIRGSNNCFVQYVNIYRERGITKHASQCEALLQQANPMRFPV